MSDWSDAFNMVRAAVQPDSEPVLTYGDGNTPDPNSELDRLILDNLRASTWQPNTAYVCGTTIMPTVQDGHRYHCTKSGTSGSSEPIFNSGSGSITSDGTVQWTEWGPDYANPYDVRRAIRAGWLMKAAKASEYEAPDESRIYDKCMQQADQYLPVGVA